MRFLIAALAVGVLLSIAPARATELCGEGPFVSDPTVAHGVIRAAEVFKVSAAAGQTFAKLAATFYLNLAAGHSSEEARSIAGALLHASCVELTRGEDHAKLTWHTAESQHRACTELVRY